MAKLDNILVYEWEAWHGFLISHLIEGHVTARYDDDFEIFEPALNPKIKAVLLHINLSRSGHFPAKRNALLRQLQDSGLLILNQGVDDISKTHLHKLLNDAEIPIIKASARGNSDELLFVKSNLNYGGFTEQQLPEPLKQKLTDNHFGPVNAYNKYYVKTRAEIAPALWQDKTVVIEKYIDNPEDSFYRVYGFGDSLIVVKAHTKAVIKKLSGDPRDCNYFFNKDQIINGKTTLPSNLQQVLSLFIERVPLCFFCLDIVHDNNQFYIIDLNLTPWSGEQPQTGDAVDFMCQGAQTYLHRVLNQ